MAFLEHTIRIATYILAVIAIIFLILKIIGKSPSDITLLTILIGILIGHSFYIHQTIGEFREFKKSVKNSFTRVKEDISSINNKLDILISKK